MRDRVVDGGVVALDRVEAAVGFLHEFVEMDAPFARDLGGLEKHVHQHGFAAPDIADQIEAVRVVVGLVHLLAVQQLADPAVRRFVRMRVVAAQFGPEILQMFGGARLRRIVDQVSGRDAGPVRRDDARL
jgi:hypothetical protein